jgi:predicted membrane channel-forming protein YqfA (hemolysin III family)
MQNIRKPELITYGVIIFLVVLGSILSLLTPDFFKNVFVVEDGPIEWLTVFVLLACAGVCFWRVFHLRKKKAKLFLSMTCLLGLLFVFFAGEEISWGQRIFNIETPEWFEKKNAQKETNLHNLRVGGVKINKLIFVYGMGLVLLTYWFVITPAYRKNARVARVMDALGAPIPQKHLVIAYVVLIFAIQLLIFSTKRGELLECTGVMLFLLNLLYPYNRENFR